MALIQAFAGALGGTFADMWKDIITVGPFDEHTVVMPGVLRQTNRGRGSNTRGSEGVISNGSKIYVPVGTAAFIYDQSGIESVITQAGGYEYQNGESTIFNGDGIGKSVFDAIGDRFAFGGQPSVNKRVAFINLREIRGVKFGTPAPLVYHDRFYGTDLEIRARGVMSLQVTDPVRFVCNFVPANVDCYTFDNPRARSQVLSEFLQSFMVAVNALSERYRISQLPAQSNEIAKSVAADRGNAGTWPGRFGFALAGIGIESIEFTPESRELVKRYSQQHMDMKAYEDISMQAGNMAAQQKIAQGIQNHGLGDMGGMVFGMNMAQGLGPAAQMPGAPGAGTWPGQQAAAPAESAAPASAATPARPAAPTMSLEEQLDAVKKLKELLDAGILSQEEFDVKKKQILGL
ncbi:SPFH domain-containing protein [Bifidobacterium sp. CP2]|uniref:SPFH domain-containing protein n=1 Tax=Bifidobacterium sp. CP2 TaxID=2809025 RepID=UPI001BDD3DAD|nr:SPFH domain-containing protein [Bifidobacterium sp. CP2]MBT1181013.1 SPFH domain-containing protein [Bifidobacterium sp. CP2]